MENIIIKENNNSIEIELTIVDNNNIEHIFDYLDYILNSIFINKKKLNNKEIKITLGSYNKIKKDSKEILENRYL